jgi:hypothetical protein
MKNTVKKRHGREIIRGHSGMGPLEDFAHLALPRSTARVWQMVAVMRFMKRL